jgi:hypothetical protein
MSFFLLQRFLCDIPIIIGGLFISAFKVRPEDILLI